MSDTGFNLSAALTASGPLTEAISCYKNFEKRQIGWVKVELLPKSA